MPSRRGFVAERGDIDEQVELDVVVVEDDLRRLWETSNKERGSAREVQVGWNALSSATTSLDVS
jgi:hypothetical protein